MTAKPPAVYRLLDLFSGIGGFSLGLERSGGFKTVAFCEIEPFCRKVLAKHWPKVPCYDDIRTLTAERLAADGIAVDAVCGGFPCQDISTAGKGAGITGERSGLWSEYARLVGELRPQYVIVENVAALLGRGMGRVLGDLASLGYDAEWHCIPASALGAPHRRDRLWIVGYPGSEASGGNRRAILGEKTEGGSEWLAHGNIAIRLEFAGSNGLVAFPEGRIGRYVRWGGASKDVGGNGLGNRTWEPEPNVGRVAYGVPSRVDRVKGLGNSLVPQIPEIIGRAIMAADEV